MSHSTAVRARKILAKAGGRMKAVASVWSMLVLLSVPLVSQAPAPRTPVDVAKLGPQVGARVPGFTLRDQSNKTWTLPSVMGPKGAMIVFYRSVDW